MTFKQAILGLLITGCAVDTDEQTTTAEPAAIAAACCRCDAAPKWYPPGSITVGFPVHIPPDASGGCSSYNGQAGSINFAPRMNYESPGLHDCQPVAMTGSSCPDKFTPKEQPTQWPSTTAD